MKKLYFDSAATSFPKPESVIEAVTDYMKNYGTNVNRGGYQSAYSTASVIYDTREKLCRFFEFSPCENVVFTQNITYALNMILKGYLKRGDHVLVSAMEHNAVMRPLVQLQKQGVSFSRIPCTNQGDLIVEKVETLIKSNTKAIILTSASNVCGTRMPLKKIGELCERYGLTFIVDSAQEAGVFPVSMKEMKIDILAFTGHKGLLAPQGIGGFLISDKIAKEVEPLITGGTGSASDSEETPEILPDKFEAGTLNLPAIFGLNASLQYLNHVGIEEIQKKELKLTKQFLDGIKQIDGIQVIGHEGIENRVPVVSLQCDWMDEAELAFLLDSEYGIMTRVGMHCAPNAHKTLGTFPRGTIRFSFGYENTKEEVEQVLQAIRKIGKGQR